MKGYVFDCYFSDNGGGKQVFQVRAADKQKAIEKAFKRAEKNARGDINPATWSVKLNLLASR